MAAFIAIAASFLTQLVAAAVAIFRAIAWTSCVPLWLVAVLTVAAWHYGGAWDAPRADAVERMPIVRPDRPHIFPIFNRAPASAAADCICVDCTCIDCPTDCPTPTPKAAAIVAVPDPISTPQQADDEEPKAAAAVTPRAQAPQPSRSYRAAGLFGFRRLPGASSCGPNGCR